MTTETIEEGGNVEVDVGAKGRWTAVEETDRDGQPKLDDEGKPVTSYHMIKTTSLTPNGSYVIETMCGITAPWNQTLVDHLPGGPGTGHDKCVSAAEAEAAQDAKAAEKEAKAAEAESDDEEPAPAPKAAVKSK
jgi:hypothetical protein